LISLGSYNPSPGQGREGERPILLTADHVGTSKSLNPSKVRIVREGEIFDDGLNRLARCLVRNPALNQDAAFQTNVQLDRLAECRRLRREAHGKIRLVSRRDELDELIGRGSWSWHSGQTIMTGRIGRRR